MTNRPGPLRGRDKSKDTMIRKIMRSDRALCDEGYVEEADLPTYDEYWMCSWHELALNVSSLDAKYRY